MPKEGDFINCPNKDCNGQATWVCLGEPEGDFYSCEKCDGCFDENFKEIGDKCQEDEFETIKNTIINHIKTCKSIQEIENTISDIDNELYEGVKDDGGF